MNFRQLTTKQFQSINTDSLTVSDLINYGKEAFVRMREVARSMFKRISSLRKAYDGYPTAAPRGTSRTVYPLSYDKNNPMSGFNEAALAWSFENQQSTREYYECEEPTYTEWYIAKCDRLRKLVDQEIAMEETLVEAQEILIK
jgi:nitrogen-specific signal transduction histidine kinase